ncbi:MAG: isoprenyl transferase [Hyphomonadaceae bacterium]|nr:isoprenyl transferase [Hyphomonadaceae bacterium]
MASQPVSGPAARQGASDAIPAHVAIIMDGNGRWAKSRGLPRAAGHERGVEALRRTVEAAREIGIRYVTVFSFSTENWRRPTSEVSALFGLLKAYIRRDLARLKREGVRVRIAGTRDNLPEDIAKLVDEAERETIDNSQFHLTVAFNYGGREEIVRAAQNLAARVAAGDLQPSEITEEKFSTALDTRDLPDPDLLIRTSGEHRISNFLLWQCAYAELVFSDVLWPDFDETALRAAVTEFAGRERRYGAVTAGAS